MTTTTKIISKTFCYISMVAAIIWCLTDHSIAQNITYFYTIISFPIVLLIGGLILFISIISKGLEHEPDFYNHFKTEEATKIYKDLKKRDNGILYSIELVIYYIIILLMAATGHLIMATLWLVIQVIAKWVKDTYYKIHEGALEYIDSLDNSEEEHLGI